VVFFTFFLLAQFCDIAKLAIIDKLILSNLAIEKYEGKKKLTSFLGKGGRGIFFKPSLNLCFFSPNFHNDAKSSTTKKTTIYHTTNGITLNIKDVSEFFGDHMPFIGIYV
jgi:hypothetical protein